MDYFDLCLKILKEQDIKDKEDIINCINILKNMLITGVASQDIVKGIYEKYKDDIEDINNIKKKINSRIGRQVNSFDIGNTNTIIANINALIDSLYKVLLLRFFKDRVDDEVKEGLVTEEDKVIYELLRMMVN